MAENISWTDASPVGAAFSMVVMTMYLQEKAVRSAQVLQFWESRDG